MTHSREGTASRTYQPASSLRNLTPDDKLPTHSLFLRPLLHHTSVAFAQPVLPLLDPLPAVDAVSLLPSPALLHTGPRSHLLLAARVDERAEGRHASSSSRSFLTAVAPFRGPTRVALARIGQGKGGRGGVAERTAVVGRPRWGLARDGWAPDRFLADHPLWLCS